MVEKKSPLVMPPDFNELPLPQQTNQVTDNEENTDRPKRGAIQICNEFMQQTSLCRTGVQKQSL